MSIEHHQRFCHLFFVSNFTCCKFVTLKENILSHTLLHYSDQVHSSGCLLWVIRIGLSPLMPQDLYLTLLLDSLPTKKLSPPPFLHASLDPSLDCRPHIGKKVIKYSLMALDKFYPKLCLWCTFSVS